MPDYSVKTTISAVDKATEVVRGIGAAFSRLMAPIKAVNQAVADPKTTALGKIGSAVDGVAGRFRSGLGSITSWLPALGALGAAASLGGLWSMTKKAAEGYEGAALAAKKLGVSTGDLSVWRFGAKLVNVEAEALEKGLVKLNKTTYDAATGKNKDVALLYQRMGISMRNARGEVKGVGESLEDIAEAFKRTENGATRDAMAIALFGKAGAELLPFLIKGRQGITELRAEMKKYSGLTAQHRSDLGDLAESYKHFDKAGSGLSSRLSAAMAPIMVKVVNLTTDWIVANRELIGQAVDRKMAGITRAATFVAKAFTAILAVPIVAEWMKGVDVGTAFDVALGALGLTLAGPVFAALQTVIAAVIKLNLAMWANPWVLAIAAIAAAAYAIYANWGPISAWFGSQMDAISAAFDRGWGSGLWEIFKRFNIVTLITEAINGLSKWLFGIDLFEAGRQILQRLIDGVRSLLPDFNAIWAPIERGMNWVTSTGRSAAFTNDSNFGASSSPDFPMFTAPPAFSPGASGAPAAPQRTEVNVKVDFANTPPGTATTVETAGAAKVTRNVGYSMLPPGLGQSY